MSPSWRHPIHQRVLEAFGSPPEDARAAALDAWARGPEPRLLVEADDRVLARWAARRQGAVVLVPIARRLGTALERDALSLFHVQLERFTGRPEKVRPDVLRAAIARALTGDRDPEVEGELLVVIDGADHPLAWTFGGEIPLIAELGKGVRVAVSARSIDAARAALGGDRDLPVLHARAEGSRGEATPPAGSILELLRGALAPIPRGDLAAAASSSPEALRAELDALAPWIDEVEGDRVVLRADDPLEAEEPSGGLASFVRSAAREVPLRPYVLETLGAHLDRARAPRAEYDALTAPGWCVARLSRPGGPFALAWDARTARRAAGDALVRGARDPETLVALIRALLVESSAIERLDAEPGDLLGDERGFEEEGDEHEDEYGDLPGEPRVWRGDGAQRAHVLAAAIRTIGVADPNAAALLGAAETAAMDDPAALLELAELALPAELTKTRARPPAPELLARIAAGASIDEIVAEAARLGLYGEARVALVEAASEERREALAVAFTRRILRAPPFDVDHLFDAIRFGPWLPLDEAARLVRCAVDELVFAPSRPDLLKDAFGHDLAHLLPLSARLAGPAAVVGVAREVIEVADLLP